MKKWNSRYISLCTNMLLATSAIANPLLAYGTTGTNSTPDGKIQFAPPTGVISNIPALITFAIQILFVVAGLVAFVYLLLGGIKWITSGGDKGQVEAARNQIIQALIGLVVVFAAWGMIVLIEQLLNIPLGFSEPFVAPSSNNLNTVPNF